MAVRYSAASSGGKSGTIAPAKPAPFVSAAKRATPYLNGML